MSSVLCSSASWRLCVRALHARRVESPGDYAEPLKRSEDTCRSCSAFRVVAALREDYSAGSAGDNRVEDAPSSVPLFLRVVTALREDCSAGSAGDCSA